MTRQENLTAMFALNAAAANTSDPEVRLNIHSAYYIHQIVEALLSENTDSLLTLANHG
jgi:hypothetical protein